MNLEFETEQLNNYIRQIFPESKYYEFKSNNYFAQVLQLINQYPPLIAYVQEYVERHGMPDDALINFMNPEITNLSAPLNYNLIHFIIKLTPCNIKTDTYKNALMLFCRHYPTCMYNYNSMHEELLNVLINKFSNNLLDVDCNQSNIINQICSKYIITKHFSMKNSMTVNIILSRAINILDDEGMKNLINDKDKKNLNPVQNCLYYRNLEIFQTLCGYRKYFNEETHKCIQSNSELLEIFNKVINEEQTICNLSNDVKNLNLVIN